MAYVQIARFVDLTEAQAAAAGLRASRIPVWLQNEHWGQTAFYMLFAIGGFGLWTPEEYAEAARAYVSSCRNVEREALDWTGHPRVLSGMPLAALGLFLAVTVGGIPAWALVAVRRKATVFTVIVLMLVVAMSLGLLWLMWRPLVVREY